MLHTCSASPDLTLPFKYGDTAWAGHTLPLRFVILVEVFNTASS
jgi:hypothetical protein